MHVVNLLIIAAVDPDQITFLRTLREEIDPGLLRRGEPEIHDTFGEIRVDDALTAHMFGLSCLPPGQNSADPGSLTPLETWEAMAAFTEGFVMIVDCTISTTFADAKTIIGFFHGQRHIPFVVAANHFDAPGAVAVAQIPTAIGLDNSAKVVACDISQQESAKHVLLELLHAILA